MRHAYCSALLCLFSLSALADTAPDPRRIKGLVGITLGNDWATINQSTNVLLISGAPAPDTFTPTPSGSSTGNNISSKFLAGASAGVEFPIHSINSIWQTSVAYYHAGNFEITGTDYMFGITDLGNKAYSYLVNNQRLMLENKLMLSLKDRYYSSPGFYMFFMFGLGASRNIASGFEETPLEDTTVPNGAFENGTANSFSYSVGVGFESEIAGYLRIGLGYRFSDLGKVTLGPYDIGDTTNTITTTSMPTQELIVLFTFL